MKIEIHLNDPKYCNGCLLNISEYGYCNLFSIGTKAEITKEQCSECNQEKSIIKIIRPKQCADKYGP